MIGAARHLLAQGEVPDPYLNGFHLTIDTTKAGSPTNTFILPTPSAGTYNYYVDWGEGGAADHVTVNTPQTHVYAAPGTYTVKIRGTFPRVYFNNSGDKLKVLSIQLGDVGWTSFWLAFAGCANLTTLTGPANTASATDFTSMFTNCLAFNSPITQILTDSATKLGGMFYNCYAFNQSVSHFVTTNVTEMHNMFRGAWVFNQSLANFNTANVTRMDNMFYQAYAFNGSLVGWDTSKVTIMGGMFGLAYAFNQSVSHFNTANVTNMASMFSSALAFNQSVANFNTAKVTTMAAMFNNAQAFKQSLAALNMALVANVTDMCKSCNINATGTSTNYDATLVAWELQDLVNSLAVHFGTSKYGDSGQAARTAIATDDLWTFTDGGHI